MFFNMYPYTNFHELNLDEILRLMRELHHEWDEFTAVNKITNAGAWDITKQYQAWTVVSDNNVGYISLKPVPAGVAISNIEYWGVIADYNILITDLSNRISILEGRADATDLWKATNKPLIDIAMSPFNRKRRIVILSDSYGSIAGTDGDFLPDMIASYLGVDAADFYNGQLNGVGFTDYNIGTTFQDLLITVGANIADKTTITDIIVMGGCNDYASVREVISAYIDNFCAYVHTNYVNAKIHIAHVGRTWNAANCATMAQTSIPGYKECSKYGASYIFNSEFIMHDHSLFNVDLVHPNANGIDLMAIAVASGVINGSCSIYRTGNITFQKDANTLSSVDTVSLNYDIIELINNETISIVLPYTNGTVLTVLGISLSSVTTVPYYFPICGGAGVMSVPGGQSNIIPCEVVVYNGSMVISEAHDGYLKLDSDGIWRCQLNARTPITNAKYLEIAIKPTTYPAMLC